MCPQYDGTDIPSFQMCVRVPRLDSRYTQPHLPLATKTDAPMPAVPDSPMPISELTDMDALLSRPIVLGSRSPRRQELLSLLVPKERIQILPPSTPDEPGFNGLRDETDIVDRLRLIARMKNANVRARTECPRGALVLTADTTIVAGMPGDYAVLGQPPATPDWQETVREWFNRHYFGQTHRAMTAVVLSHPDGRQFEEVVETRVTMRHADAALLGWYLNTGEPLGKAGGYALQGAGSVFIEQVDGSLSNVVGLPLEAVRVMLSLLR